MIFHSVGGGTGAGFGALLHDELDALHGKAPKLEFAVYPSPLVATSVVEPYNAVFATAKSTNYQDCTVPPESVLC
jgi:tubulin alpha